MPLYDRPFKGGLTSLTDQAGWAGTGYAHPERGREGRLRRVRATATIVVLLMLVGVVAPAAAQVTLTMADPPPDGDVLMPNELRLSFSAPIAPDGAMLTLTTSR